MTELVYEPGKGRPELVPYIVAIRDKEKEPLWDNTLPRIVKARELYEEGYVELITGYDSGNVILYAIPRKDRDLDPERIGYFFIDEPIEAEAN